MTLETHFTRSGTWLFRWRSYIPLAFIALLLLQYRHFSYPLGSRRAALAWEFVCLAVSLAGLGIRAVTIGLVPPGTSGRSTRAGMGAETLNTEGMYSLVRHPLYLGNALMWAGIALLPRLWWLALLIMLGFALYYERIMYSEEVFLRTRFGAAFEEWSRATPAFWPRLHGWRASNREFSARAVLHREPSAMLSMLACFAAFDLVQGRVVQGLWVTDRVWPAILAGGVAVYLVMRVVTRRGPRRHPIPPAKELQPLEK